MLGRWILGFFKRILNIWDDREWDYYTHTALDPKLPAFSRWQVSLHSKQQAPESEADQLLPKQNHTLILHDKSGLTQDDIVYFSTDLGRVEILEKKLQTELRSRNAGWFWFDQIKNRNLDFIHNIKLGEDLPESTAADDDIESTRREFFRG
jgi:hypothetical protein